MQLIIRKENFIGLRELCYLWRHLFIHIILWAGHIASAGSAVMVWGIRVCSCRTLSLPLVGYASTNIHHNISRFRDFHQKTCPYFLTDGFINIYAILRTAKNRFSFCSCVFYIKCDILTASRKRHQFIINYKILKRIHW